jgi:hypothetical protein
MKVSNAGPEVPDFLWDLKCPGNMWSVHEARHRLRHDGTRWNRRPVSLARLPFPCMATERAVRGPWNWDLMHMMLERAILVSTR